jgi:hypothetical protein
MSSEFRPDVSEAIITSDVVLAKAQKFEGSVAGSYIEVYEIASVLTSRKAHNQAAEDRGYERSRVPSTTRLVRVHVTDHEARLYLRLHHRRIESEVRLVRSAITIILALMCDACEDHHSLTSIHQEMTEKVM